MFTQILTLPFKIPEVYQGFAEAHGVIRSTDAGLVLEFQVKDSFVGMVKSRVNEVSIPFNELVSIRLKKGWFKQLLLVRARSMATLVDVPGHEAGEVALKIARKDLRIAREMVSLLMLALSEKQLQGATEARLHS